MATPADDYSEQSFFWHEFINELAPLNPRTAMQYFEMSPWYRIEPPSNNQILRMQNTGMDVTEIDEAEQLRALVGVEFALVVDQGPSLFIIHKRRRVSSDEVHPLEAYYIINNHIQQAPPLYNLLSTRLNATSHLLMKSMSILKKQMPPFTPTKGHAWPILYDPTTAFVKEGPKGAGTGTTAGGSVDGSAMDIDAPAPGGSSTHPGQNSQFSLTNAAGQVSVTTPLLHAIRTTAAHVQQKAASRVVDGRKRVIRSAAFMGMASSPASPGEAIASPAAGPGSSLSGPNAHQSQKTKADGSATHASVSGKRVGSPQAGVSAQFSGADGGTPLEERARKKKKRAGTKDAQTPILARSPTTGPA